MFNNIAWKFRKNSDSFVLSNHTVTIGAYMCNIFQIINKEWDEGKTTTSKNEEIYKPLTIITLFWRTLLYFRSLWRSVSTFKIHTFKVRKWSEPHSRDSVVNQHHANLDPAVLVAWGIRAMGFTSISHVKSSNFESANTLSKCESKATLP